MVLSCDRVLARVLETRSRGGSLNYMRDPSLPSFFDLDPLGLPVVQIAQYRRNAKTLSMH
jgi:hypothetical protein